ncbi:hypothetical protein GIB67_008959 [Kingdonia uniflora]|uniref:RING-type domain-containing protein n=1 Tax=Kingdonia uniflora TaxID=39325 RepID=A0A7J7LVJ0_9MAGN|nr:hypothetical protein GIB67_008959 [Kingdonia uniflora]
MADDESLKMRLQDLQKQLGKKYSFEESVCAIKSIILNNYSSASPSLKKLMYVVVSRVATILQTRYTSPGLWLAGKGLFEEAERVVTASVEKQHLKHCIAKASKHLHDVVNQPEVSVSSQNRGSTYLFEGHLTVDSEPPRANWLVARDLLDNVGLEAESSQGQGEDISPSERLSSLLEELANRSGNTLNLNEAIEASMQEIGVGPRRVPPASKEVVRKLPVITVTEEILASLGSETECAVCREELVLNDKMQELPCKHLFHPPCLKPWLVIYLELDEN